MPYSLRIDAYPFSLYTIVENVLLTQKESRIEAKDWQEAKKIRRQVFGLKEALIASTEHPLKNKAAKITTELKDNVLYIKHVDTSVAEAVTIAAKLIEGE